MVATPGPQAALITILSISRAVIVIALLICQQDHFSVRAECAPICIVGELSRMAACQIRQPRAFCFFTSVVSKIPQNRWLYPSDTSLCVSVFELGLQLTIGTSCRGKLAPFQRSQPPKLKLPGF